MEHISPDMLQKDMHDSRVKEFINAVLKGSAKERFVVVSEMPRRAVKEVMRLTGKNTAGFQVVLDTNAVKHIVKRHGKKGTHDQSMLNAEMISMVGHVVRNYDEVSFDGTHTTGYLDEEGRPAPLVRFKKRIDKVIYVVVACTETKSKRAYIVTAYATGTKEKQPSNPC